MRVVTYNIHGGRSADGNRVSIDEQAAILAAIEPDVVMLQEAEVRVPQIGDLAAVLGDRLHMHYAQGELAEAVLSRFPITSWHETVVPQPFHWPWDQTGDKGIVIAHCQVGGAPAHLVSTHYNVRHKAYRLKHAQMLVNLLNQLPPDDLVLFGADVNADVMAPEVQLLFTGAHLTDVRQEIAPNAPVGIDMVMYRPASELRATQYRADPDLTGASDHPPVIADFDLTLSPVDNAIVSVQTPAAMQLGATANGSARVQNTGTTTWDPASYALALRPENAQSWGAGTAAGPVPALSPGETTDVSLTLIAAGEVGDQSITWEMRHGDVWFGGPALAGVAVTADQQTATCTQLAAEGADLAAAIADINSLLADPTLPKQARPQLMARRKSLQARLTAVETEQQSLGC